MNITTPEFSYILGFLWADGWIRNDKYHKEIRLECLKSDIEEIHPHFLKVFDWKIYYRNRKNRRPQARLNLTHRELVSFLVQNNYTSHNTKSATIIQHISDDLKPFWFRGLVDGDGSWYLNTKLRKRQFRVTSCLEQDWTYFENLCKVIDVDYQIYRRKPSKKGYTSSAIETANKKSLTNLGNYIYQSYPQDKIGLSRKYNKWIEIIQSYKKSPQVIHSGADAIKV